MRIGRLLILLLVMTFLGTILGGLSGGLLGAAVPMKVTVASEATGREAATEPQTSGSLTLEGTTDRSPWVAGAALGAGFGLMAGVGAGLVLGVLDQVVLAIREQKGRTGTT